ncbi:MarR family winged helix-turn-helix transcriptional regulator [Clostridium ihumii]|uniref:MarR family winged helix-turn-helix transcriptional regulator n=1 Tax=Clostridium ihumii TaxID=1470356 RepID=UPI000553A99D|nr:MarR family transcriptional regulator [Clostridium ihumii]
MSFNDLKNEKLNSVLVDLFNYILKIEEKSLASGKIKDLSITEVHTIEAIGIDSEKTMSEVAKSLKITVGTLTTAINKLVKKGYVDRNRPEDDRRTVKISLTQKGKVIHRAHSMFHNELIRSMLCELEEEEEIVLIKALSKIEEFFKGKYEDL